MHDTASSPSWLMVDLRPVPCTQRGTVLDSRPWATMVDMSGERPANHWKRKRATS